MNKNATMAAVPRIPEYAILISQVGLRAGSLGLLYPRTWAAPDFVITMAYARRNALHGFQIHKDLPNSPSTKGVVHVWVGQKHLNCFIFKCFFYRSSPANFHLSNA